MSDSHSRPAAQTIPYWIAEPVLIFYDGPCGLCQHFVRWVLQRTRRDHFRFYSLDALAGTAWETRIRSELGLDLKSSVIVWKNGELLGRSDAILSVLAELGLPWSLGAASRIVPKRIRDWAYDFIASRRARKAEAQTFCETLPPEYQPLLLSGTPEVLAHFRTRPGVFLGAQWRNLLVMNFEVPPEALRPYLPPGTELDPFEGKHLISLVGFQFTRTSIFKLLLPFDSEFEEVNLRFYVRRALPDGSLRRGVVFIREVVPSPVIAWVARTFYQERYVAHSMSHSGHALGPTADFPKPRTLIEYCWSKAGADHGLQAVVSGEPEPLVPGSLEEFILEHYFGYALQPDGGTIEYEVEHPRWRIWKPLETSVSGSIPDFYPEAFAEALRKKPHSIVVAEGSPVRVFRGRRLATAFAAE